MVYNPGGFGHTRLQKKFRKGVQRPVQYSTMDKVKIVSAIDKTRWQVTEFLQVSLSQISRWRAKSSSLKQSTWPNTIALLKGPAAFLLEVKEQLVNFVNKWHGKGIPVSCLYLVKMTWTKICMPPRRRRTKWRVDSFTVESRFCQQDSSCAEIKHFKLHVAAWPDPSYGHTNRTSSSWRSCQEAKRSPWNDVNRSPAFNLNMDQKLIWHVMIKKITIQSKSVPPWATAST